MPADKLIQLKPPCVADRGIREKRNTRKETFSTPAFRKWSPPPPTIMCLTWEFWFGSRTHSGTEREEGGMILIQEFFWWTEPEGGWKAMWFVVLLFVCMFGLLVLLLRPLPQPFVKPLHQ